MTETGSLLLWSLAGVVLGGLFYGGLWLTVRSLPGARRPGLRLLASTLLRSAGALAAFALAVRVGGAPATLAVLAGFLAARLVLATRLPPQTGGPP